MLSLVCIDNLVSCPSVQLTEKAPASQSHHLVHIFAPTARASSIRIEAKACVGSLLADKIKSVREPFVGNPFVAQLEGEGLEGVAMTLDRLARGGGLCIPRDKNMALSATLEMIYVMCR